MESSNKGYINVKATREGLVGKTTASGYVIDVHVPFVALPSRRALFLPIEVINPWTQKRVVAIVLDVGPWYTDDDDYVMGGKRPRAERSGRTNQAGIDLGERVWNAIGMTDNTEVSWRFIDE